MNPENQMSNDERMAKPEFQKPNLERLRGCRPEIFCHLRFGLLSGFDIRISGFYRSSSACGKLVSCKADAERACAAPIAKRMKRIPEPELMDTDEQARAYAAADFSAADQSYVPLCSGTFPN